MTKENVKCPYGCELQGETKIICALISGKNVPCEDRDRTDCALKDILLNLQAKEQELRKLKENSKNKCAFRCLGNEFYPDTQREIDRLKIEVEQLQAGKSFYKTWYRAKHSDVENELGRLQAENEKLKEKLQLYEDVKEGLATDFKDNRCCNLFMVYPDLRENCFYDRYIKYKKALDEIYKIASKVWEDDEIVYQATGVCYEILSIIKQAKGEE